jgi:hypothetical protein
MRSSDEIFSCKNFSGEEVQQGNGGTASTTGIERGQRATEKEGGTTSRWRKMTGSCGQRSQARLKKGGTGPK